MNTRASTMDFEVIKDRLLWRIKAAEMKNEWLMLHVIKNATFGTPEYSQARREQVKLDGIFRGLTDAWEEIARCYFGEITQ